jgi:Flp pilus assembly protein TadG
MARHHTWAPRTAQAGTAAVEFAFVSIALFTLLIGIMEFSRVLFYWNSAEEATRLGARIAVVCDKDDAVIKVKMREIFPVVPANKILVDYEPAGCTIQTCERVTVSIDSGVPIATFIPFVALSLALPPFTASLPRESMNGVGGTNPVCS